MANNEINDTVKQLISSILWALISVFFVGIVSPTADEYHMFPHFLRLSDPDLFKNDLIFKNFEPQYAYIGFFYKILSNFMPFFYISVSNVIITWTILIFSLTRLSSLLVNIRIPTVIIAILLILGRTKMTLIGAHYLASDSFYPEYLGFSLSLLAIAMIAERKVRLASVIITCIFFIYPLIGSYLLLIFLILLPVISVDKKEIMLSFAILGTGVIAGFLPNALAYSCDLSQKNVGIYLSVWKFIRSNWHFNPAFWAQRGAYLIGVIIVSISLFYILYEKYRNDKFKISVLVLSILLVFTFIGVLNVSYFMIPWLFMVNPMKVSPLIIGIFFCFSIVVIAERIRCKLFFSTLFLLSVSGFLEFVTVLFVLILGDFIWHKLEIKLSENKRATKKLYTGIFGEYSNVFWDALTLISGIVIIKLILPERLMNIQLPSFFISSIGLIILFVIRKSSLRNIGIVVLFGISLVNYAAGTFPKGVKLIRPMSEFQDICSFIKSKTPKETCVVIPPEFAEFQVLSKRAAFVSFFHFSRIPENGIEWVERMKMVKGLHRDCCSEKITGEMQVDRNAYYTMNKDDFIAIAKKYNFVDYCIMQKDMPLTFPVIYENRLYRLYKIE